MTLNWNDLTGILEKIDEMQVKSSERDVLEGNKAVASFVQQVLKEASTHIPNPEKRLQFYQACEKYLNDEKLENNESYVRAVYQIMEAEDDEAKTAALAENPMVKVVREVAHIREQLFSELHEVTYQTAYQLEQKKKQEVLEAEKAQKAEAQEKAIETERNRLLTTIQKPEAAFVQHGFRLVPHLDLDVAAELKLEGASPYISIESLRQDLEDFKKVEGLREEDRKLVDQAESNLRMCHALELESLTVADLDIATSRLMDIFRPEFAKLQPGEHLIIPGGSRRFLMGGHAVIYKITKQPDGRFVFEIFNTGTGSFASTKRADYVRAFRVTMPANMLQSEEFLKMLFHPILEHKGGGSYVEVAKKIEAYFKAQDIKEEEGFEAPHQRRGTCTFESATAYLRSVFPEPLYEAFELFYTEKASKTFDSMIKTDRAKALLLPERDKTVQARKETLAAHVIGWIKNPDLKDRYQVLLKSILPSLHDDTPTGMRIKNE